MLAFPCSYCEQTIEAEDALAGCVVVCTHCGRSVIAPQGNDPFWPSPSPLPPTARSAMIRTIVATLLFGALGALFGGLLCYGAVWAATYRMFGLGLADAATAGWIGCALGGFFCGLLAWRVVRD